MLAATGVRTHRLSQQIPSEFHLFLTVNGAEAVERIRRKGMDKLNTHANFTSLVLPAMKFSGSLAGLSLLNQGSESARGFTGRIADFLGVPIGKDLRIPRRAMRKLPDKATIQALLYRWSFGVLAASAFNNESDDDSSVDGLVDDDGSWG